MKIDTEEQESVRQEVQAFLDRLGPHARPTYERLLEAVDQGEVPEDLQEHLGRVLELSLGSGRFKRIHGPHVEMGVRRLFLQTPQGRSQRRSLDDANEALANLKGQEIHHLQFSLTNPGTFTFLIDTDKCQAQLVIDSNGVQVRRLDMGI